MTQFRSSACEYDLGVGFSSSPPWGQGPPGGWARPLRGLGPGEGAEEVARMLEP